MLTLYKLSVNIQSHVNSVSDNIQQVSLYCQYVLLQQVINQYSTYYLYIKSTSSELTVNCCQLKVNSVMSTYDQEHDVIYSWLSTNYE